MVTLEVMGLNKLAELYHLFMCFENIQFLFDVKVLAVKKIPRFLKVQCCYVLSQVFDLAVVVVSLN